MRCFGLGEEYSGQVLASFEHGDTSDDSDDDGDVLERALQEEMCSSEEEDSEIGEKEQGAPGAATRSHQREEELEEGEEMESWHS
jgi:hypothetical protein